MFKNETQKLKTLNHENILKIIGFKIGGIYKKKNGTEKTVNYIIFEECLKGTLMDYITYKPLGENIAKYYCSQLLKGFISFILSFLYNFLSYFILARYWDKTLQS